MKLHSSVFLLICLITLSSCVNDKDVIVDETTNKVFNTQLRTYPFDKSPVAEVAQNGLILPVKTEDEIRDMFRKVSSLTILDYSFEKFSDGFYLVGTSDAATIYIGLDALSSSSRLYANGGFLGCSGSTCSKCKKKQTVADCYCSGTGVDDCSLE